MTVLSVSRGTRSVILLWGLVLSSIQVWEIATSQGAEEVPYGVTIEVQQGTSTLRDSDSSRLNSGEAALIRVHVWTAADPDMPGQIEDPSSLMEAVAPSGSRTRFADLERVGPGRYQTVYVFDETGAWTIVALPDLSNRDLLPSGSTDRLSFTVAQATDSGAGGRSALPAVMAGLLVFLAIAVGVSVARRPRRLGPPPPPVPHDSWWNPP